MTSWLAYGRRLPGKRPTRKNLRLEERVGIRGRVGKENCETYFGDSDITTRSAVLSALEALTRQTFVVVKPLKEYTSSRSGLRTFSCTLHSIKLGTTLVISYQSLSTDETEKSG
jgi:hypothetical protein